MRTMSETSKTTLNIPTFTLLESQKKGKRKGLRKYLKRLWLKAPLKWERQYPTKSRMCRVLYRINPRRNTLRHMLIKLTKLNTKILKAAREKQQIVYKGIPLWSSADFSGRTL